jgi:BirA family biotin operon repressor/biotin-[acetyl-CoA-carboxylase] ligase
MLPTALLEQLADGQWHTRPALADSLRLSADELTRQLVELEAVGLTLMVDGAGVGLPEPLGWIDVATIEARLGRKSGACIDRIERFVEVESTNRFLLDVTPPPPGKARVAIAEYQHGGRGRRGRSWNMPPAAGIALSVAWCFEYAPAGLTALSLAVGAVARRAVATAVGIDVGLKWPNDLIVDQGKLGGILVELDRLELGACRVVAGIGINVKVPEAYLASVSNFRHGARDLASRSSVPVDRTALAAALIEQLVDLFVDFAASGFEPYRAEWLAAHVLDGRAVELTTPTGVDFGTVRGIEPDGALIFEDAAGKRRRIISGDVTVRASA